MVNNKTIVNRKTAIMKNPMPSSLSGLFTLCEKAADALHTHESEIGIMHNTEALVRSELASARSANSRFQSAKAARLAATAARPWPIGTCCWRTVRWPVPTAPVLPCCA